MLLFEFEKTYFDKEQMSNEFIGHPLLEERMEDNIDLNQIIGKNKALISVYPGSRKSEIEVLTPILLEFIKLMNVKYSDFTYVFHSTKTFKNLLQSFIKSKNLNNLALLHNLQFFFIICLF